MALVQRWHNQQSCSSHQGAGVMIRQIHQRKEQDIQIRLLHASSMLLVVTQQILGHLFSVSDDQQDAFVWYFMSQLKAKAFC